MVKRAREVSIIVVNRDDPRVARTLDALATYAESEAVEVIVVDASQGRLESIREGHPWVTWIDFTSSSGHRRTIAEQRNTGIHGSSGQTVVFLDANCVPREGWLDALVGPVASNGESIVAGAVISEGRATVHDRDDPYDLQADGYLTECATINVAIARSVFATVGEFDEALGFAEDVDFAWRAVDQGYRIYYARSARVSHEWDGKSGDFERAFRYGVGRVRLFRKHPSRLRRLTSLDVNALVYPLFLIGLPIAAVFPCYLLLVTIPLVKNRKNHPVATVIYGLAYGGGVLSELVHLPVMKYQRR